MMFQRCQESEFVTDQLDIGFWLGLRCHHNALLDEMRNFP